MVTAFSIFKKEIVVNDYRKFVSICYHLLKFHLFGWKFSLFSSFCATDGNIFHFPSSTKLEAHRNFFWLHTSPFKSSMLQRALLDFLCFPVFVPPSIQPHLSTARWPQIIGHSNHQLSTTGCHLAHPLSNHQSSAIVTTNHWPPSVATNNSPSMY